MNIFKRVACDLKKVNVIKAGVLSLFAMVLSFAFISTANAYQVENHTYYDETCGALRIAQENSFSYIKNSSPAREVRRGVTKTSSTFIKTNTATGFATDIADFDMSDKPVGTPTLQYLHDNGVTHKVDTDGDGVEETDMEFPESGYTLTETATAGTDTITKYVYDSVTGTTTAKY